MEPDNCSPQLDYTRLLFNKKNKNNNKTTNGDATTTCLAESHEALDLMKTLLTSQFENEIMQTCDKYMNLFQRAATNIESNQGENISQNILNSILQSMLRNTRYAVSRRYSQFQPTSSTLSTKIRTIKVPRRKPRTLQNQKMDWYKQISSKGCYNKETADTSNNIETDATDKLEEKENQIINDTEDNCN